MKAKQNGINNLETLWLCSVNIINKCVFILQHKRFQQEMCIYMDSWIWNWFTNWWKRIYWWRHRTATSVSQDKLLRVSQPGVSKQVTINAKFYFLNIFRPFLIKASDSPPPKGGNWPEAPPFEQENKEDLYRGSQRCMWIHGTLFK